VAAVLEAKSSVAIDDAGGAVHVWHTAISGKATVGLAHGSTRSRAKAIDHACAQGIALNTYNDLAVRLGTTTKRRAAEQRDELASP
jgi:hypothetical protein